VDIYFLIYLPVYVAYTYVTMHTEFYYFVIYKKFADKISSILICVQEDASLHSLFYLETALHVSGGITTHHQDAKQLYLQHLVFVTPLLLPVAIAAGSSNGVTNTRCCKYSCLRS